MMLGVGGGEKVWGWGVGLVIGYLEREVRLDLVWGVEVGLFLMC